MPIDRIVLALDAAAPHVAAAIASRDELIGTLHDARQPGETPDLLALVDRLLADTATDKSRIGAVAVLRGPGSFTGLRVACATALGLAEALRVPMTAVSTLEALALWAAPCSGATLAVIDALRGDWYTQRFTASGQDGILQLEAPAIRSGPEIRLEGVELAVGFEARRFVDVFAPALRALEAIEVVSTVALAAARGRWSWRPELALEPLYLRPPATSARR
jgi:tRNA threonylcarbamoyl adenosine modification protein YeaZ